MRRLLSIVTLSVLFAIALPGPAGRAVAAPSDQRFPVSFIITREDCPELTADVTGTGEGRLSSRVHVNADGTFHMRVSFTAHGTATDTLGRTYTISESDSLFTFNGKFEGDPQSRQPLPPYSLTTTENFHLIGQGSAPNVKVHGLLHMSVRSDGTVSAFVSQEAENESCEEIF